MDYRSNQKEEIIKHLRTKKSSFLVWDSLGDEISVEEMQKVINEENLPYKNNGYFMGCQSWKYV